MLTILTPSDKAIAQADVASHTTSFGPDTSYAAVGMLREAIARLDTLLSTPEAQQPAQGGPFYNALRLAASASTAGMASIIAGQMRLT